MNFQYRGTQAQVWRWPRTLALLSVSLILGGLLTACVNLFSPLAVTNVYVVGDALSIVQASDNTVTGEIDTSGVDIAVTPDGSKIYVSNFARDTVSVIHTASNEVTTVIDVGDGPLGLAMSPGGSEMFVANRNSGSLSVVEIARDEVKETIDIGIGAKPRDLVVPPDGKFVFVITECCKSRIIKISLATHNIISDTVIHSQLSADSIAITGNGSRAYVSVPFNGFIRVVDTSRNTVSATVPLFFAPRNMLVAPSGDRLYVSQTGGDQVAIVQTSNNSVVDTVSVGDKPEGLAITPDGSRLYVANSGDNTISVIELSDSVQSSGDPVRAAQVSSTIPVGNNPQAVAAGVLTRQPNRIIGGGGE